jgi:amino acid transporter
MNKMHSLAKIVLTGFALYLAFHICTYLIMIPFALLSDFRYESSILSIVLFLFISLCLAVCVYLLIYHRDKWARNIVGTTDLPDPDVEIQWLPVAFRLIAVVVGLFCLYSFVTKIIWVVQRLAMAKATSSSPGYRQIFTSKILSAEQILGWLILLVIGIYFLCGAPHFVRWQVKKTLEQCKKLPTSI